MPKRREKALDRIGPAAEPGPDASFQNRDSLAGEKAWTAGFAAKREVVRRMAREAVEAHENGKTLPLSDLLV